MAHYGLTWHELLWKMKWPVMQRMLADGAKYGKPEDSKDKKVEEALAHINDIKRG